MTEPTLVKWHDDIEPLSHGGVEEVRRHPSSIAELRLVATIDQLRAEGRKYEQALRELAVACEFTIENMSPSTPFRCALDAAWDLVDPDHAVRDQALLNYGCTECGGKLERLDDATVPELCANCIADEELERRKVAAARRLARKDD